MRIKRVALKYISRRGGQRAFFSHVIYPCASITEEWSSHLAHAVIRIRNGRSSHCWSCSWSVVVLEGLCIGAGGTAFIRWGWCPVRRGLERGAALTLAVLSDLHTHARLKRRSFRTHKYTHQHQNFSPLTKRIIWWKNNGACCWVVETYFFFSF